MRWCVGVVTEWRWGSRRGARSPACVPMEKRRGDAAKSSLCYILAGINNYRVLLASNLL